MDKEIDFDSGEVPKHLGRIAYSLAEWEGPIADELELKVSDVEGIKKKYPNNLQLQS